eukprot:6379842-Prymnesium_polylepis.2
MPGTMYMHYTHRSPERSGHSALSSADRGRHFDDGDLDARGLLSTANALGDTYRRHANVGDGKVRQWWVKAFGFGRERREVHQHGRMARRVAHGDLERCRRRHGCLLRATTQTKVRWDLAVHVLHPTPQIDLTWQPSRVFQLEACCAQHLDRLTDQLHSDWEVMRSFSVQVAQWVYERFERRCRVQPESEDVRPAQPRFLRELVLDKIIERHSQAVGVLAALEEAVVVTIARMRRIRIDLV